MGQVLHGSATTTEAVRRAIQLREESVRSLAKRYGVSPTTVQKWRKRTSTADARMGPKEPRSTVLTVEEEAIIVAFRRHTLLPLDDCLYGLQPTIPHLTRSSLHRGTIGNSVCERRVEHQAAMARVKRSPKMTANCALAMTHSRGPI
ncbi:helix-turn-helix domain-containing protein, partial [Methylobacterium sp. WL64]|uniref:helix-turn-helix domain-containing protein n=1 Tax=Methylobacterium sp. WL64 TaxID=2603894 RepID=UPI0034D36898